MASRTKLITADGLAHQRRLLAVMIGSTLAVIALTFSFCATAEGQGKKYKELEVLDEYFLESTAPRLRQDRTGPYFEELTDDEIKTINSRNRQKKSKVQDDSRTVEGILEGGGSLDNPLIKTFFEGFVFAEMTQLSEEKISNMGNLRTEFFKDYLSKKVTGATREQFIQTIVIPNLLKIANDNYHPAARMNAVYILGMLDSQAANRLDDQNPIPSSAALNELLTLLDRDTTPAYLKVAALVGIQRHVEIDNVIAGQIGADVKQKIAANATSVVSGTATGQDAWDKNLDYWMQRRSVQVLGFLGQPDSLDLLVTVLNSEDSSIWLRFDALEAIGRLDLTTVAAEKVRGTSLAVTEFLANSLEAESKTIEANVAKLIYDNMLFEDLDLEATGVEYGPNADAPNIGGRSGGGGRGGAGAPPGAGRGGGGRGGSGAGGISGLGGTGGIGGFGGFGGMDGGDSGLGRGGADRGGGRGQGSTGKPADAKPLVELPNYQLENSRRRIKALAFTGKRVLKNEGKGLQPLAGEEAKSFIDGVVSELDLLLDGSNVGIIDLEDRDLDLTKEKTKSYTQQLSELCAKTAGILQKKVRNEKGEAEPSPLGEPDPIAGSAPDAAAEAAPASKPEETGPDF